MIFKTWHQQEMLVFVLHVAGYCLHFESRSQKSPECITLLCWCCWCCCWCCCCQCCHLVIPHLPAFRPSPSLKPRTEPRSTRRGKRREEVNQKQPTERTIKNPSPTIGDNRWVHRKTHSEVSNVERERSPRRSRVTDFSVTPLLVLSIRSRFTTFGLLKKSPLFGVSLVKRRNSPNFWAQKCNMFGYDMHEHVYK